MSGSISHPSPSCDASGWGDGWGDGSRITNSTTTTSEISTPTGEITRSGNRDPIYDLSDYVDSEDDAEVKNGGSLGNSMDIVAIEEASGSIVVDDTTELNPAPPVPNASTIGNVTVEKGSADMPIEIAEDDDDIVCTGHKPAVAPGSDLTYFEREVEQLLSLTGAMKTYRDDILQLRCGGVSEMRSERMRAMFAILRSHYMDLFDRSLRDPVGPIKVDVEFTVKK